MPFGSHGQTAGACRTAGSRPRPGRQKQTRVLDLRTGRQRVLPGSIVGVDDTGSRLVTSRVATNGEESSYLQLRDAQWRPVGRAQRVDGHVAEVVFLPGGRELAVARDEVVDIHDARTLAFSRTLEGHSGEVLGIELGGPARGLLWTAGRDGTAVAFDLTGTRGVLRTVEPGRGRRTRRCSGRPGGAHPVVRRRSSTPRASSTSRRGATSSASSSRSPTACARSGTPPSPRTEGSPWPECSSGPTTSPRRSPTGGASSCGTPTPGSWRAPSTSRGNPTGSPSPQMGNTCSSTAQGAGPSTT